MGRGREGGETLGGRREGKGNDTGGFRMGIRGGVDLQRCPSSDSSEHTSPRIPVGIHAPYMAFHQLRPAIFASPSWKTLSKSALYRPTCCRHTPCPVSFHTTYS